MRVTRSASLVGVLLVASVLCVLAAPVAAADGGKAHSRKAPTSLTAGSRYLALGDSVTFGYQEAQVVPAPNYHDAASFAAYPGMIGAELHVRVANASCPGETSSSLIDPSGPSNGCESSPAGPGGYRTAFPLHVSYKGSQLGFALSYLRRHHNVALVSLMIGANDFFRCQETTADHCASELKATTATVTKNIHTILGSIRRKAHYKGQIAIVNYYSLDYSSPATSGQSQLLNQVQDAAAKPFHVEIADGYGELGNAARIFGGSTCAAGLLTHLSTGGCGIHPSYSGQALLAQAVLKATR